MDEVKGPSEGEEETRRQKGSPRRFKRLGSRRKELEEERLGKKPRAEVTS